MKADDLFRRRAVLPGLHALIVGVSEYPYLLPPTAPGDPPSHQLGLRKLATAASAAFRLYCWLVARADHFAVPLATCRLLLSPSAAEQAELADWAPRANFDNFAKAASGWRKDAGTHRGNVALFYFAGHGLQRADNSEVLLLDEFGGNPDKILGKCLEVSNLTDGMASMSADDTMARTQLYFLDACRSLPPELVKYNRTPADNIWDILRPDNTPFIDTRFAPVFYTQPGSQAFGIENLGSVFGETLLRCLQGGAGTFDPQRRRWTVTAKSLITAFQAQLDLVNREYGTNQVVEVSRYGPDAALHDLDAPPLVEVEITLEPSNTRDHAQILVQDAKGKQVLKIAPVPALHRDSVPAGNYQVRAMIDIPNQDDRRANQFLTADPPHTLWPLTLE